jgi:hypothetical protein
LRIASASTLARLGSRRHMISTIGFRKVVAKVVK